MEHLDGWYIGNKWSFEWPCILRGFADLPGQSEKGGKLAPEQGPRSRRNRDLPDHDGKFPDGPT